MSKVKRKIKWEKKYEKFKNKYKAEKDCQDRLEKNLWPEGYECPKCGHNKHYKPYIHGKSDIKLYECKKCKHQVSVTSMIKIFKKTRTPLMIWFKLIFLIAQRGKNISTTELMEKVGYRKKKYKTIHRLRKKIEKKLTKKSALKIFKGIARRADMEKISTSYK